MCNIYISNLIYALRAEEIQGEGKFVPVPK
jgi:hypothetical protein